MPIDSVSRLKHDDLHEPYILDSRIPPHVSSVIMKGLSLSGRDRIQTITELVTKLFEQPSDDEETATVAAIQAAEARREAASRQKAVNNNIPRLQRRDPNQPPVQRSAPPQHRQAPPQRERRYREEEDYVYEKASAADKIKVPIIIGILLIAILMLIAVFVYNIMYDPQEEEDPRAKRRHSSSVSDSVTDGDEEEATQAGDIQMPSLVGRFYDQTSEKWAEYFTLEPVYEFTDNYDMDMIYEQSIEEGTMITQGAVIDVKVSKGKITAYIPDFENVTVAQYKLRLEKAGIPEENYEMVEAKTGNGATDSITEIQLDGEKVNPGTEFKNKSGKKLTIYYISAKTTGGTTYNSYETYDNTTANYNYADTTVTSAYYQEQTQAYTEPPTQAAYTDPPAPVYTDPPAPVVPDTPAPVETPVDNGGGGEAQQ